MSRKPTLLNQSIGVYKLVLEQTWWFFTHLWSYSNYYFRGSLSI